MFRRPTLRSTLTMLVLVGALVGGAHLAAYAVGGRPIHDGRASGNTLETYQVVLGHAHQKLSDSAFVTAKVPPGSYQITLAGLVSPDVDGSLTCEVGDKRFFTAANAGLGRLWALDRRPSVDRNGATVDAVGAVRIKKGVKIVLGCIFGAPTWTVDKPIVATLTQVNGIATRPTHGFTPDRTAAR